MKKSGAPGQNEKTIKGYVDTETKISIKYDGNFSSSSIITNPT